jgi:hypothetical protein
VFALNVSDEPRLDGLFNDLARCVLEQVGYTPTAVVQILEELRAAIDREGAGGVGNCHVQFHSDSGKMRIVVSFGGGHECRVAHALPD